MKTLLTAAALMFFASTAHAGKIAVTDGDIAGLLNYKKVKVEYVYDGMVVGKQLTEDEYVAKRVGEKNEKEAGTGDTWKASWYADRDGEYHPKFEELVNKYTKKAGMVLGRDISEPDLLMTVKITKLEPGYYVYVSKRPAMLDMTISFAKPGAPDTPIATLTNLNSPGSPYPTVAMRVGEAFAKAAKDLGKYLSKKGV